MSCSLSFIVVIWFFSFKYLIRLYLNDRVTIEYVNIMSFLQTGTFILEHFVILFSAFMKIIGKERLQLMLSLMLFVPMYVLLQSMLVLVIPLDIYGCRVGTMISNIIYMCILLLVYFYYEKSFLVNSERQVIEEEESIVELIENN